MLPILVFSSALAVAPWAAAKSLDSDERIRVTALPLAAAEVGQLRSVTVIDRADIELAPVSNLADLLAMVAGVEVRRRGAGGVQADVGIRGTAYEQTLILVDGIPMSDPQTGHHDMNLPIPLAMIERIEVVRGPGAVLYGGHATGGMINIVTRTPQTLEIGAELALGQNAYAQAGASLGSGNRSWSHLLAADARRSDGHLADEPTDFDLRQLAYRGQWRHDRGRLSWGLGAEDKDFGAFKFYTADFPDQREETGLRNAWLSVEQDLGGGWTLSPELYWRRHEDWFRTLVGQTAFINEHETRVLGQGVAVRHVAQHSSSGFGLKRRDERIDSNALGQRRRDEDSAWMARRQDLGEQFALELSLAMVDFAEHGRYWLPSGALRWQASDAWGWFVAAGRTARQPSYTELFLQTAGNRGRDDLGTERSTLIELGWQWQHDQHRLDGAAFERRTERLIDWAREPGSVTWLADQLDDHRTRGLELDWRWQPRYTRVDELGLSWTWVDTRLADGGREIKYALDVPRSSVRAHLRLSPSPQWRLAVDARLAETRQGPNAYWLNARLSRLLSQGELFVEGSNLLNREIPEAGFAPLPGRWLIGGWRYRMR
ncbi:MAG: TonB-dependent receptor plug domain-containing protein [Wenzhouxiangella sp.]